MYLCVWERNIFIILVARLVPEGGIPVRPHKGGELLDAVEAGRVLDTQAIVGHIGDLADVSMVRHSDQLVPNLDLRRKLEQLRQHAAEKLVLGALAHCVVDGLKAAEGRQG